MMKQLLVETAFVICSISMVVIMFWHYNNNQKRIEAVIDESDKSQMSEKATNSVNVQEDTESVDFTGKVNIDVEMPEYIYKTDSSVKQMGYNPKTVGRDEFNRPLQVVEMQDLYGEKYNAKYIGSSEKEIYLTFTMGYEYSNNGVKNTDRVLDILKEKNVKAAFFVTGEYIEDEKELCQRIVSEGHKLGCHGYEHPSDGIASQPVEVFIEDTKKIYNAIYELTNQEPYLYRFGSGIWNERALAILSEMGFEVIFHSYTYADYFVDRQPKESVALQGLMDNLHSGEILYLHTVSNTNIKILPEFIDKVREMGYQFKEL